MTNEIFISYSKINEEATEVVVSGLEKQGVSCWIAPRDVLPGTSYAESIVNAIERCKVFVLILSEASNKSKQVLREVDHASSQEVVILPFLIEDIKPSGSMAYYLGPEQWLEATSPPLEDHIRKLGEIISHLLGSKDESSEGEVLAETIQESKDEMEIEKDRLRNEVDQVLTDPSRGSEQTKKDDPAFGMQINPFTFGNPVSTRDRFFGREGDIRQVISRLLSAGESTSVVGERRIGKTSLLKYLANPDTAPELGLPPEKFCLVYIDFQGLTDITPVRFWQRVLRKMEAAICKPELVSEIQNLRQQDTFDLFDLEDLFEAISGEGITIVLFLDEFEYVTRNPNFSADFFGGLRALAIHQDLSLVTGTRRELIDLCHSEEIKGSPFFNIFVNLVLRPFSREKVLEMIAGYIARTELSVVDRELEMILQLSGGHPFFVQMAGYYLVEAKWKNEAGDELITNIVNNFDKQSEPHFQYFWSHSSESEKITLLTILTLGEKKASKKTRPTIENVTRIHARAHLDIPELMKRGLLLENREEGTYAIFSRSLVGWIMREISATAGKEESQETVQDWVREVNPDNPKALNNVLPKIKKQYWPIVKTVVSELSFELIGAATFEILTKTLLS